VAFHCLHPFLVSDSAVSLCHPQALSEIYSLSLHDALPISTLFGRLVTAAISVIDNDDVFVARIVSSGAMSSNCLNIFNFNSRFRSEEHTSELQSRFDLVCRLLLE